MRSRLFAVLLCLCFNAARSAEITIGIASVDDGKPTKYDGGNFVGKLADGSRFNDGMTVAHRELPIGSCVEVSRIGRDANVHLARIDDRGPCATPQCQARAPHLLKRKIDLKPKLASALGCDGLCAVAFWPAPCNAPAAERGLRELRARALGRLLRSASPSSFVPLVVPTELLCGASPAGPAFAVPP